MSPGSRRTAGDMSGGEWSKPAGSGLSWISHTESDPLLRRDSGLMSLDKKLRKQGRQGTGSFSGHDVAIEESFSDPKVAAHNVYNPIPAATPRVGAYAWSKAVDRVAAKHNVALSAAMTLGVVGSTALGAWAGFVIGTPLGPAGWAVGMAVGAFVGALVGTALVLSDQIALWLAGLDTAAFAQSDEWQPDMEDALASFAAEGLSVDDAASARLGRLSRRNWNKLLHIPHDLVGDRTFRRHARKVLLLQITTRDTGFDDLLALRDGLVAARRAGRLDVEGLQRAWPVLREIAWQVRAYEGDDNDAAVGRESGTLDVALALMEAGDDDLASSVEAYRGLALEGAVSDDVAARFETHELVRQLSVPPGMDDPGQRTAFRREILRQAALPDATMDDLRRLRADLVAAWQANRSDPDWLRSEATD